MIKVLVVDDSAVAREYLTHLLSSDPEIQVVGTATNGEEALAAVEGIKPDVITMDVHMPKMDGFDATRRIMSTHPTPIVIVSASWGPEVSRTFKAVEAGALAVVRRPAGLGNAEHRESAEELVRTVKLMSEVRVVRRWAQPRRIAPILIPPAMEVALTPAGEQIKVIALGASTGGPVVLKTILAALPGDLTVPVLIVQHMACGFIQGFVDWLAQGCSLPVHLATHGEDLLPGRVYVAPDGYQMKVGANKKIVLTKDELENGLRPSVSFLFRSVADVYGPNAVGVLLTGMGRDGAEELKRMKDKGATTIAQDKESSVVHGMPGEAIELGAATYVLSPEKIAAALARLSLQKGNDR